MLQIGCMLQWLGGCLMELWKLKGAKACILNYRDITLADDEGKLFLSFLRTALMVAVAALTGASQCGSG